MKQKEDRECCTRYQQTQPHTSALNKIRESEFSNTYSALPLGQPCSSPQMVAADAVAKAVEVGILFDQLDTAYEVLPRCILASAEYRVLGEEIHA